MIAKVAHISLVLEGDCEGRGVVRLALDPTSGVWAAGEVVLVVADVRAHAHPVGTSVHRLHH